MNECRQADRQTKTDKQTTPWSSRIVKYQNEGTTWNSRIVIYNGGSFLFCLSVPFLLSVLRSVWPSGLVWSRLVSSRCRNHLGRHVHGWCRLLVIFQVNMSSTNVLGQWKNMVCYLSVYASCSTWYIFCFSYYIFVHRNACGSFFAVWFNHLNYRVFSRRITIGILLVSPPCYSNKTFASL